MMLKLHVYQVLKSKTTVISCFGLQDEQAFPTVPVVSFACTAPCKYKGMIYQQEKAQE